MSLARRLRRETGAQIFPLALIMVFWVVLFALVLSNLIFLAAAKIKAQNSADAIAISAGTLKARLLNQITEKNRAIEYGGLLRQVYGEALSKRYVPYTDAEIGAYAAAVQTGNSVEQELLPKYQNEFGALLRGISRQNGLDDSRIKAGIFPWQAGSAQSQPLQVRWESLVAGPQTLLLREKYSISDPGFYAVQSRLEWDLKNWLIGSAWIGLPIPNLTTRSRVEIFDAAGDHAAPWDHFWKVRLAQPDESADLHLQQEMRP